MQTITKAFIAKPHFFKEETKFKINNSKIEYTDVLTYVALRSFNNVQYDSCFPSQQTISERAGISKKFVGKSIERLESAEFINVFISGKQRLRSKYTFRKFQYFDKIPYDIFSCNDLSLYEKSMLLCLREIGHTPVDLKGTINELASMLGVTYKTLYCQLNSLIQKGYIKRKSSNWHRLLKLDWNFEEKVNRDVNSNSFFVMS